MRNTVRLGAAAMVAGVVAFGLMAMSGGRTVQAQKQYHDQFVKQYPDLAEKAKTAKCAVCHVGADKKNRNEYAKLLEKALGEKKVKDADKIEAALKEIEAKDAPNGKTYKEVIDGGSLPGDAKKGGGKKPPVRGVAKPDSSNN